MDFQAYTWVDMRTLNIEAKSYGPSRVNYATGSEIYIDDEITYYGSFSYKKKGKKKILNWKKSTLNGYENDSFSAIGFTIDGRDYLQAAKNNDGERLRILALSGDDTVGVFRLKLTF